MNFSSKKMSSKKSYLLVLLPVFAAFISTFSQAQEVLDRIVAVVGNQIILESELATQVQIFLAQSGITNPSPDQTQKLRNDVLEQMINDRLILVRSEERRVGKECRS